MGPGFRREEGKSVAHASLDPNIVTAAKLVPGSDPEAGVQRLPLV
jgi:hypothetical protein